MTDLPPFELQHLVLFILLAFAVARLTRLVYKDTIFALPRKQLVEWLKDPVREKKGNHDTVQYVQRHGWVTYLREKIAYLIECPYCVGAYTTAIVLLGYRIWVGSLVAPVLWWFAVWMAAIVVLEFTDGEAK